MRLSTFGIMRGIDHCPGEEFLAKFRLARMRESMRAAKLFMK
jgi:hypothetical protein